MNTTPWPTKTLSSIVTPSQINVWLEILQLSPIVASAWTSTKAPTFVPFPIVQPYRLTRSGWKMRTSFPSFTVAAINDCPFCSYFLAYTPTGRSEPGIWSVSTNR